MYLKNWVYFSSYSEDIEIVRKQYPSEPFQYLEPALRLEYSEAVKILNDNGVAMGDEEDLTTSNEKFLGKLVRERVSKNFNSSSFHVDCPEFWYIT